MGTEPTPPQLRPSYSKPGEVNVETMATALREQGVSEEKILKFRNLANVLRPKYQGQIIPLTEAALSIGAEVHWIN